MRQSSTIRNVKSFVVPYFRDPDGEVKLIVARSAKYATPTIEFFGGGNEPGETAMACAQREFFEETSGLCRIHLQRAQFFEHNVGPTAKVTVYYIDVSDEMWLVDHLLTNFAAARRYYLARGIECFTEMSDIVVMPLHTVSSTGDYLRVQNKDMFILSTLRKCVQPNPKFVKA